MPSKIIYIGTPTQIYKLKETKSLTRFLNLPAYLNDFLVKEEGAEIVIDREEDEFGIFHYNNTTIEAIYSKQGNQIKAFGAEKQILAVEKGLAKKLKQAEVNLEETAPAKSRFKGHRATSKEDSPLDNVSNAGHPY